VKKKKTARIKKKEVASDYYKNCRSTAKYEREKNPEKKSRLAPKSNGEWASIRNKSRRAFAVNKEDGAWTVLVNGGGTFD